MRSVLVTGGTGSFGHEFIRQLLDTPASRIVVFSRDEVKQQQMRQHGFSDPRLRWFIGDVRDRDRLRRAMQGVDTVVHAAALKQVDTCEANPIEAVETNINGTRNVIDAALDTDVHRVLMLSSDKAVDPANLYGASKLVAEKLIVDANVYSRRGGTKFAATRYGNVISSRGSVLPVFERQQQDCEPLTVTDPAMTRFVLTLPQGVAFVRRALRVMQGGEVFVPKLAAVTIPQIAAAVSWPQPPHITVTGRRPGEKLHELLLSVNESHRALDQGWCYLLQPIQDLGGRWDGHRLADGFAFSSDTATRLDVSGFRRLAGMAGTLEVVA